MYCQLVRSKVHLFAVALLLSLTFQSCSKQDDLVSPVTISQAQDCSQGALPVACKKVSLVAGQHTVVGTIDVATRNDDVLVTYNVTAPKTYLSELHLDVFTSLNQLQASKKLSSGGAIPGKFLFQKSCNSSSKVTSYTFSIPKIYLKLIGSSDCFFIAAHAALSTGETAWGGLCTESAQGVSLDAAKQFPGKNWSVYFEFCKNECTPSKTIDFTYAWEDINGSYNDGDYNDLVVQSDITKTTNELRVNFLATARGASFDHMFKFKIPKTGITAISGATYTEDAGYYYVTVFESTKAALPPSPKGFANTEAGVTCVPFASKEVVLTINSSFPYNSAKPFEPFISVYTSGSVGTGDSYDLYIYEVSHRDTWTADNGNVYPNGILIPSDWRWPLEQVFIAGPYPNFTSINSPTGFTSNWANTLADPASTFDKNACD